MGVGIVGPSTEGLTEREAWAVLATAEGVSPAAFASLIRRFGAASPVLDAARRPGARPLRRPPPDPGLVGKDPLRDRRLVDAIVAAASDEAILKLIESAARAGSTIVTLDDEDYPPRLRQIPDAPPVLFVTGERQALRARPTIAVVGTRRASEAGRRLAARLAGEMAAAGAAIVSGLAVGIDGVAHDAALREQGRTIAVLGSGHLRLYPSAHRGLAGRIGRAGGAVVSELAPTTRGTSFGFPKRNRIVSGIADATVVVEAPARSGALITARLALGQGRECFVVPGGLGDEGFAGSVAFLREHHGAVRIVAGAIELLEDLGLGQAPIVQAAGRGSLGQTERRVAVAIADGQATLDDLVTALDLAPATVLGTITRLEERGLVVDVFGRYRPHGPLATRGRRALHEDPAEAGVAQGARAPPGGPDMPADGPGPAPPRSRGRSATIAAPFGAVLPCRGSGCPAGFSQASARTHCLRGRRPSAGRPPKLPTPSDEPGAEPIATSPDAARRAAAAPRLAQAHRRALTALRVRPRTLRAAMIGAAAVAVMTVGAGLATLTSPATTAAPTSVRSDPLPTLAFETWIRTGHEVDAPVNIDFATPMDERSVADSLEVDPPTALGLTWEVDRTRLVISAMTGWRPDTYYVVTVGTTAHDVEGRPLGRTARAAFLTRPAAVARLAAPTAVAGTIGPRSVLAVTVDGVVDPAALAAAVRIEPAVDGHVGVVPARDPAEPDGLPTWRAVFTPQAALPPDTSFTLSLDPAFTDIDGKPVRAREPLVVRTATVPTVVRFRPVGAATGIGTAANISLGFDQPMDRAATERALVVSVGGKAVAGKVGWAEGDTVLVFDPDADFAEGSKVTIGVGVGARAAGGYPLAAARAVSFTTLTPPAVATRSSVGTGSSGSGGSGGGSGGGSVGSGSWTAIEQWYLGLMNCNRAGGLVASSGGCSDGPGGVRALKLDAGISSKVTRPYARVLALKNACGHTYDGSYADRLRRGGYGSYSHRGENVGCYNGGTVRAGVLWAHRQFQSERSYRGPHWVNLMNPNFDRAGIGVWVAYGRIRLVIDFFHP